MTVGSEAYSKIDNMSPIHRSDAARYLIDLLLVPIYFFTIPYEGEIVPIEGLFPTLSIDNRRRQS